MSEIRSVGNTSSRYFHVFAFIPYDIKYTPCDVLVLKKVVAKKVAKCDYSGCKTVGHLTSPHRTGNSSTYYS